MSGEALTTTQWQKRCDALARRVAELEAAGQRIMAEVAPWFDYRSNDTAQYIATPLPPNGNKTRLPLEAFNELRRALASSGGTGDGLREIVERAIAYTLDVAVPGMTIAQIADRVLAGERATRDEGAAGKAGSGPMGASEVRPTDPLPVALPSREQAGRADSSASERDGRFDLAYADEPTKEQRAAIRREAIEEAARECDACPDQHWGPWCAAKVRALAGDAPAERGET